ncbi:hypothetical protein BHM03_00050306 [Ensete ventricosum]|nr:hypothetical protein BHM03_00050306 [Ensete ventricosum]
MYHPVHTSLIADRYVDRLLSGDTAKINHRQLIPNIDDRLMAKSIVDGRLKKKKRKRRSTWLSSSPACCPRALTAREPSSPSLPGGRP